MAQGRHATAIGLGGVPATIDTLVAAARAEKPVRIEPEAMERIAAANALLERLVGEGREIYGVTTGLGAAIDTSVAASHALQRRIPPARAVGVGRRASREEVRAFMTARLMRFCAGRSGISPAVVQTLAAMLNAGIHPDIRMTGSVGEADLASLAQMALALIGEGTVEYGGADMPAAEAFANAGLELPTFALKDGIALVLSSAASVGAAALLVADARRAIGAHFCAAALSLEGYRGNLSPFSQQAASIRPAQGQAEAAGRLRNLLRGGDLAAPSAARRLQDPLSFRCLASVGGAALCFLSAFEAAAETELGSADDNPALLVEQEAVLANANFDPTHLVLLGEALGLAFARLCVCAGERAMAMMSPGSSELPRFLAPPLAGRNGFATVQKTIAALVAEAQHLANPMPVVILPVADRVEDYATMASAVMEKTVAIISRLQHLTAIELIVAAQAVDMRGPLRLGHGTAMVQREVRRHVAPLDEDRVLGPEISALASALAQGALDEIHDRERDNG